MKGRLWQTAIGLYCAAILRETPHSRFSFSLPWKNYAIKPRVQVKNSCQWHRGVVTRALVITNRCPVYRHIHSRAQATVQRNIARFAVWHKVVINIAAVNIRLYWTSRSHYRGNKCSIGPSWHFHSHFSRSSAHLSARFRYQLRIRILIAQFNTECDGLLRGFNRNRYRAWYQIFGLAFG